MQIKGKKLELLISENQIKDKVKQLATQINNDFKNQSLLVVGILKGCFMFFADLVRELEGKVYIDFMQVSSYHANMKSSGEVIFIKDLSQDIKDKNVLIVDDIIDTSITLEAVVRKLYQRGPKVIKTCVLLDKKERRKINFNADYTGFTIPNKFVVGYGLDWAEEGRTFREIYCVVD